LSFRAAAEAGHVAQPSLSTQIAHAERAFGVQVFELPGFLRWCCHDGSTHAIGRADLRGHVDTVIRLR